MSEEHLLTGLASMIILGIGAQWLAWRLRLPAILLLLLVGVLVGPITHFLAPEALLGPLLLPWVSLSVAVILFEGGLSLRLTDLSQIGSVVRNLLTLGLGITWLVSACAAYFLLGFDLPLALLLGAILVVTGPTVIGPLLRDVQPTARLGSILRWEGILNDPLGAMLAVLVFEAIFAGVPHGAATLVLLGVLKTLAIGGVAGFLGARLVVLLLKHYWVPDFLQNAVSLTIVVAAFWLSNLLQAEAGLLAVTLMGVLLANQRDVSIRHIVEFKENLRVLLISSLFIVLAARMRAENLAYIGGSSLVFLAVLILVARPTAVFLSTWGSELSLRERLFLAWMAPRGIVAAAVSSVFALRLAEAGHPQALLLVPVTFLVIMGTVALYGLTASRVARWLGVAWPNPQGVLMVGAHSWARTLAGALQEKGFPVALVDTNWTHVAAARMMGLRASYANVLSERIVDELDLQGIGRLLALTPNDEVNSLAALHFAEVFGRAEVYQLPLHQEESSPKGEVPQHLHGRFLFGRGMTYEVLAERFAAGAVVKAPRLTKEFDYEAFCRLYGEGALPLFLISDTGKLIIATEDEPLSPRPGHILISLVNPIEVKEAGPPRVAVRSV